MYLKTGATLTDISQNQYLLCLEPAVFGIWVERGHKKQPVYEMYFKDDVKNKTLAVLTLNYFDNIQEKDGTLLLLKLKKSKIYHTGYFRLRLLFQWFYKKPTQSFEQLKAFASAYSYPRRVRLISFKHGDYYNIFPMDLIGVIPGTNKYVFGLRHTNSALLKIIETKKIVVSEVNHQYKDIIYSLGSHHKDGPPPVQQLPFKVMSSENYGFFIPEWVDSYKELRITKTMNLGSHMLLWAGVDNEHIIKKSAGHLYHIHYLLYLYHLKNGFAYPVV